MAQYPRLLNLDEDTEDRIRSYLDEELSNHYAERGDYIDDLNSWQQDYWAKPSTTQRTFPFLGASNIIVPLTAIAFEAVHARTMTTLWLLEPFVSSKIRVNGLPAGSDAKLESYIHYEFLENMKAKRPISNIVTELEKFGTGIGKTGYEKVVKTAVRTIGDEEQEFEVVTKSTAVIDPVPGARFLMPFAEQDPQTSPWCGEEHSKSPYQVLMLEKSGLFYEGTYEKLIQWALDRNRLAETSGGIEFTQKQEELEDTEPVLPKSMEFVEIWLAFNIDNDPRNTHKEIQIFYHRESQTLMAARYNWRDDLSRPYRYNNYIQVEHRWRGVGICKQNDQFQRETTTIHRQRLDNATLANMRMFKIHKLSGYGPSEPVFPGKMWFVDDMTHVDTIQAGEVYQSAFSNEQAVLIYSQQRTGVNEVILGMPQVGTPGTATGDLARIQEGNKKFDYVMTNVRDLINDLILDTILQIKQFGSQTPEYFDVVPGGDVIRLLFAQPPDALRKKLIFDISAVASSKNRLVDRQNWAQISQILTGYYTNMIQLAQATGDQRIMMMIIQKALTAATEAMRQVLESFGIRNIDRILAIEVDQLLQRATNETGQSGGIQIPGLEDILRAGGNGGAEGLNRVPGLANIQALANSLRGRPS